MKTKNNIWLPSLLVAIALGTAWAVRGKFGHEQGAAWAGAVGGLAIILVSKRTDWYDKVFTIALAAAFGWGMGGMISYGIVVGYGRGTDFLNVSYGLFMLFLIGALYGFTGGGMLGLALVDSAKPKVKWHQLITEMIAIGILTYALVIMQLEWLMTPPRSEMWAGCLGASIALGWYVIRLEQWSVLRVAIWSAIGSGFGFAFGNILQVLGAGSNIPFNLWNVMEYSIGFFGGLGMAYGVFTSSWPVAQMRRNHNNIVPIAIVVTIIPFIVWDQSFTSEKLSSLLALGGTPTWVQFVMWTALLLIVIMSVFVYRQDRSIMRAGQHHNLTTVRNIFIMYLGIYTLFSFLVTGVFAHPVEQYLYIVNIIVFLIYSPNTFPSMVNDAHSKRLQWMALIVISLILLIATFMLINVHGPLKDSQVRFGS